MESTTQRFANVQMPSDLDTIIEDKMLRDRLIGGAIKLENAVKAGQIPPNYHGVSKTDPADVFNNFGLEFDYEMSQPKEGKPIIFRFTFSIQSVTLKTWVEAHSKLMEGPLHQFCNSGLIFAIPGPGTEKYYKTFVDFCVKYDAEGTPIHHLHNIVEQPLTFLVHRDIVSNNDWIVKCAI